MRSTVLRKKILVSSECVDGGNWSCSGSRSNWSTFSWVDLRPFLGFWSCSSMVDCFLDKYCCTKSNDRPGQEVKKFFLIAFPHLDWVWLQNDVWWYSTSVLIYLDLYTLPAKYSSGVMNLVISLFRWVKFSIYRVWAWVSCTFRYNFSTPFVENKDIFVIKSGLASMIVQFSNGQQGLVDPWKNIRYPCLNRQVFLRMDCCMCWRDYFPFWNLDGEQIYSLLFIVAWRVEGQMMSDSPCVRHC